MSFTDLLQTINEEADRTSLDALAKKYPVLQKYAESGEAFEALRPRLKKLTPEYEAAPQKAIQELENWRAWKANNYNEATKMTREEEAVKAALAQASARVAELEARTDTTMTPEEIKAEIKAIVKATLAEEGVINSSALEARFVKALSPATKPDEKPGEIYERLNGMGLQFQNVYSALEKKAKFHEKTFGEDLDRGAVFDYMQKNSVFDAQKAYDQMNAEKLEAKRVADTQKAIEDARKEGETKGRQAALATNGGRGVPVDSGRGGGAMGFAEALREARRKREEGKEFKPKLGQGIGAQYAAERRAKLAAGVEG